MVRSNVMPTPSSMMICLRAISRATRLEAVHVRLVPLAPAAAVCAGLLPRSGCGVGCRGQGLQVQRLVEVVRQQLQMEHLGVEIGARELTSCR